MATFNYEKAKAAGYSDDEIKKFLEKPSQPGIAKQAWDSLNIPEQMATQLLSPEKPMTSSEPVISPSIAGTLISGTPRVLEESAHDIGAAISRKKTPAANPVDQGKQDVEKFIVDVLPGMVSRTAMLTGGAIKGLQAGKTAVKAVARGVSRQLESASGAARGSLEAAAKDATQILAKGKNAVQAEYEAAKGVSNAGGGIRPELAEVGKKKEFIETAAKLAKETGLTPEEALEARKELDLAKKSFTDLYYRAKRALFDDEAKKAFARADKAYQRGVFGDSLRNLMPQNTFGKTSNWKIGISSLLPMLGSAIGGAPGAATGAGIAAATMSPLVQGMAATFAGLVGRKIASPIINNPKQIIAASQVLAELARKRKGKKETR